MSISLFSWKNAGSLLLSRRFLLTVVFILGIPVFSGVLNTFSPSLFQQANAAGSQGGERYLTLAHYWHSARLRRSLLRGEDEGLKGLGEDSVWHIFGEPALHRVDGPVEVLQYRSNDCVLDLYVQDNATIHYELRPRRLEYGATFNVGTCLLTLLPEEKKVA